MRKKLIVGNWKMHKTLTEASADFQAFAQKAQELAGKCDLGIGAPAIHLSTLSPLVQNYAHIGLYAQNVHWEKEGAFTGEISVPMLQSVPYVRGSIIGHSERRQYFGETNATAGKRMGALLRARLECIFCIGETLAEREAGKLATVLRSQLVEAFEAAGVKTEDEVIGENPVRPLLAIAYEPVWAIGTGKAATPTEATEAHALVRDILSEILGAKIAERLRILYGGSVNPTNVASFMACPNVDGALVGGASLKPDAFFELCTKAAP